MADSLNYLRSKHGWAQTNRFVLRWFNLNEAPKAARETGMTSTVSRRPPISAKPKCSQRAALRTKRKSLAMGVTKKGTENEKGLDAVWNTEVQEHAAVTVNFISTRTANSDEGWKKSARTPRGKNGKPPVEMTTKRKIRTTAMLNRLISSQNRPARCRKRQFCYRIF